MAFSKFFSKMNRCIHVSLTTWGHYLIICPNNADGNKTGMLIAAEDDTMPARLTDGRAKKKPKPEVNHDRKPSVNAKFCISVFSFKKKPQKTGERFQHCGLPFLPCLILLFPFFLCQIVPEKAESCLQDKPTTCLLSHKLHNMPMR